MHQFTMRRNTGSGKQPPAGTIAPFTGAAVTMPEAPPLPAVERPPCTATPDGGAPQASRYELSGAPATPPQPAAGGGAAVLSVATMQTAPLPAVRSHPIATSFPENSGGGGLAVAEAPAPPRRAQRFAHVTCLISACISHATAVHDWSSHEE